MYSERDVHLLNSAELIAITFQEANLFFLGILVFKTRFWCSTASLRDSSDASNSES